MMKKERDYVLGTNEEEILRLGLQHRAWRAVVLSCWYEAGITVGSRVIDIGAGPGYAAIDLAEIVGPTGHVTAVERSTNFVQTMKERCERGGLKNVDVREVDLMTDQLPAGAHDFAWCRWVASFVSDPALLIEKVAKTLRPGGRAIFHEYGEYRTWRLSPRLPSQEEFVERIIQSWSETGGKTDIALDIPPLLIENGLSIRFVRPRIFCLQPNEYMWRWMASFMASAPRRLLELGKIDQTFAEKLWSDFARVEADPTSLMITPLVLEIVAQKKASP
jgi:ubiquinone/menaquinone biosynthesis C-methylase UbiE